MEFSLSDVLAGGIGTVLTQELVKFIKSKRNNRNILAETSRDINEIYNIMKHVVKNTCFEMVVIFRGEDSAGVLAAGKNLYITAMYEELSNDKDEQPIDSMLDMIIHWKADHEYYKLFSEMLSNGNVTIITDQMPNSNLKDIYNGNKIRYTKVFHLMTTKSNATVFFCSVATRATINPLPEDRAKLTSAISQLQNIFHKHRKYHI